MGAGLAYDVGDAGARAIEKGLLDVADRLGKLDRGMPGKLAGVFAKIEADVKRELEWVTPDSRTLRMRHVSAPFFATVAHSMVTGQLLEGMQ